MRIRRQQQEELVRQANNLQRRQRDINAEPFSGAWWKWIKQQYPDRTGVQGYQVPPNRQMYITNDQDVPLLQARGIKRLVRKHADRGERRRTAAANGIARTFEDFNDFVNGTNDVSGQVPDVDSTLRHFWQHHVQDGILKSKQRMANYDRHYESDLSMMSVVQQAGNPGFNAYVQNYTANL